MTSRRVTASIGYTLKEERRYDAPMNLGSVEVKFDFVQSGDQFFNRDRGKVVLERRCEKVDDLHYPKHTVVIVMPWDTEYGIVRSESEEMARESFSLCDKVLQTGGSIIITGQTTAMIMPKEKK